MANYNSNFTGAQIDEAVRRVLNDGSAKIGAIRWKFTMVDNNGAEFTGVVVASDVNGFDGSQGDIDIDLFDFLEYDIGLDRDYPAIVTGMYFQKNGIIGYIPSFGFLAKGDPLGSVLYYPAEAINYGGTIKKIERV